MRKANTTRAFYASAWCPIKRGWGFHSASGKLSAKRTDEVKSLKKNNFQLQNNFYISSSTFQVFHFVSALHATFLESHGTPAILAGALQEKA
jgi:hypothetical protein